MSLSALSFHLAEYAFCRGNWYYTKSKPFQLVMWGCENVGIEYIHSESTIKVQSSPVASNTMISHPSGSHLLSRHLLHRSLNPHLESLENSATKVVCQGYFWFSDGVITFASQQELECWQMIDLIGCWYAIWIWETGVRIIRGLDILFKAGLQLGESKQLLPIYIDDENYAG
jgi:hypothetical protein